MGKMITDIINRYKIPKELCLFMAAIFFMGIAGSSFEAIFNNFLDIRFSLTGFQRSFLELPRELPGFSVMFVAALLWFLCSRRLGALAMFLCASGALLIGFASPTYRIMILFLFVYSLGQHLFIPVWSTIGMELAKDGKTGQRLGQLNSIRNLSAIIGSFCVYLAFRYWGFSFGHVYVFAAIAFMCAASLMFFMTPRPTHSPKVFLKFHKEYKLYYLLSILYGSRKQIFLTFGPWVLVTVFHQPTQTLATLLTIGGVIGIVFQPLLGRTIDRFGERTILVLEAFFLIFVCLGYGFSKSIFPGQIAFYAICVCFLLDQMLFSVNMARSMYIKKIALHKDHVQPLLTISVTIDHVFSILIALACGTIWNRFGFQFVFLVGALIAVANLFAALQIRIPIQQTSRSR